MAAQTPSQRGAYRFGRSLQSESRDVYRNQTAVLDRGLRLDRQRGQWQEPKPEPSLAESIEQSLRARLPLRPEPKSYRDYPVQVWRLGDDQLWISLGGEAVVDYALLFKGAYGPQTWVNGYSNDVMSYVPSQRVWKEGGYEAGGFAACGLPATAWAPDIQDRITSAVDRLVKKVSVER